MAQVRIIAGEYRNTDVSGQVFTLIRDFQTTAKGGNVLVENGGQFPGFPEQIKIKVNSSSCLTRSSQQNTFSLTDFSR